MAQIRYVGPHARVHLPLPGGRMASAARGEPIEVETKFARRLVKEQPSNWEAVKEDKEPNFGHE